MRLQILHVTDCPNVPLLRQRLDKALTDTATAAEMTVQIVRDDADAAAVGMTGSPTLLLDGADPFGEPGQIPSMSCRLYRDVDGGLSGAPSVAALRQVLRGQTTDAE